MNSLFSCSRSDLIGVEMDIGDLRVHGSIGKARGILLNIEIDIEDFALLGYDPKREMDIENLYNQFELI